MSTKSELLNMLESSPGEYVSGAEIARQLNISRNAIWKAAKALEADGYVIESVNGKGYKLSEISDVLDARKIEKMITSYDCHVECFDTLSSTNTKGKELAANGALEGTIVIAESQTQGKGRMGRSFYSPSKSGLYMSMVLRPNIQPSQALLITTAAAVAVAKALTQYTTDKEIWIKWVNDVYCDKLKVCGILTEAVFDAETSGLEYAVLGIGVNMRSPKDSLPPELQNIVGFVELATVSRSELAAAIANHFFEYYRDLPDVSFLQDYRDFMHLIGKNVAILPGPVANSGRIRPDDDSYGDCERGIVLGITDEFHLLVQLKDGQIRELSSGEISH